jgi:DNA processing protein
MGLKTEQIIKILQLKGIGRKKAFSICEQARDETFKSDIELRNYIADYFTNISKDNYSDDDYKIAFEKGDNIIYKSEEENIKIISYYDDDFPNMLKQMGDKPIVLNYKGNIQILSEKIGIAIIGTREPTPEGIKAANYFGETFGRKGYNIISGLAKGCDSNAHRGCLNVYGTTTAILAHGLHTIYPKENRELAYEILEKDGILISEYFIGTGALANYFVERDRLQAGLSRGTIVIQTDIKGGTMYAVKATLKDKKKLAAIKYKNLYPHLTPKIRGNEELIADGAFPLTQSNINDFENSIQNKIPNMVTFANTVNQTEEKTVSELNYQENQMLKKKEKKHYYQKKIDIA